MSALAFASAADLADRIRTRDLSPVTVVEDALARIERSQVLNAFITVTADAARAQAAEAEREIAAGRYRGPLHGVPVSLKDLVDTKGIRTTCVAPAIGQPTVTLGGGPTDARGAMTRLVRLINFVGLPAITVPCGFGADGLPVGLQIVGRSMDEPTMLAIAHAYEQATAWHTRCPPEAPQRI